MAFSIAAYYNVSRAILFPKKVRSNPEVKHLDFNTSPTLATFPQMFIPFALLSSRGICDELLNFNIKLFVSKRIAPSPTFPRDQLKPSTPVDFLPFTEYDKMGLYQIRELEEYSKSNISKKQLLKDIIKTLGDDEYVYIFGNYFFIPNTSNYKKDHHRHQLIIHGYDSNKQEFDVSTYLKNGNFGCTKVPYWLLANSFELRYDRSYLNKFYNRNLFRIYTVNREKVKSCKIRPDIIKHQIYDHINSSNFAETQITDPIVKKWYERTNSLLGNGSHGQAGYETIIEYLRLDIVKKDIDMRITRLNWEHKKLMEIRLKRLLEIQAIKSPNLLEHYKKVTKLAHMGHLRIFQTQKGLQPIDMKTLEKEIKQMRDQETRVLEKVYHELDQN